MPIYRHYLGDLFVVKGESTYSPEKCTGYLDVIYCVHSRLNKYVSIYKDSEGKMYHNFSTDTLIVYKGLDDYSDFYVRPSWNFHEELENNVRRFEQVGGNI